MSLSCQKDLFSLPDSVHYLNCATMSPLLKSVEAAGIGGVQRKSLPYHITQDHFFDTIEIVKGLFAELINCSDKERIAVMPSVSYGMATVAKNLARKKVLSAGQKIAVVSEEFPSDVYAWEELCAENRLTLKIISPPAEPEHRGKHWNERLLESIDRETALLCLSPVHWADGTVFDLHAVSKRCKETETLFVIDGTQSFGAFPFDLQAVQPDFAVAATYKWLLGSYSLAFAYFGEFFDDGSPLERNWAMRLESNDFKNLVNYQSAFRPKAYRYNMGEMSNFIQLPMAEAALRQLLTWGVAEIQAYCKTLVTESLVALTNAGYVIESEPYRANHLFGIRIPESVDLKFIQEKLKAENVYVSFRGNAIRVSPHVYNDARDVAALTSVLQEAAVGV
jgi:selenocysteine lyase/cysteine desulfurase